MIRKQVDTLTKISTLDVKATPTKHFASTILDIKNNQYSIVTDIGTNIFATLAPSCVLIPEENDVVDIIQHQENYYISAVLVRASVSPKTFRLNGSVYAGMAESHINIQPHQLEINSNTISMKMKVLNGIGRLVQWGVKAFHIKSKTIKQESQHHHIACDKTLQVDTFNRVVSVGELDVHTANTLTQKNQQMNITTHKLNVNG